MNIIRLNEFVNLLERKGIELDSDKALKYLVEFKKVIS